MIQFTRLLLSYRCNVTINVLRLILAVPWVGLQCVSVVFPDHVHLLFDPSQCNHIITRIQHSCSIILEFARKNREHLMGLDARKPVFGILKITKTQISAFVICVFESIISKLATSKMLIF